MAKHPKLNINLESLDYGQLCQVRDQVLELIDQKRSEARQQLQQEFANEGSGIGFRSRRCVRCQERLEDCWQKDRNRSA